MVSKAFKNAGMWLDEAHRYATKYSGCSKVQVGSVIVIGNGLFVVYGANRSIPDLCKTRGCLRVEKYGEDSKNHRLPSDCRAIHSELDAITKLAQIPFGLHQSYTDETVLYVTRYPCEACARAIVSAGIKTVIYGRQQTISEETQRIFDSGKVACYHCSEWDAEDRNY